MARLALVALTFALAVPPNANGATPLDIASMWDFGKPEVSEQRFRDALPAASPDDRLILQTQIARTYGLRRDFKRAQDTLAAVAPHLDSASPRAQAYYYLELGRTHASLTHAPDANAAATRDKARAAYLRANAIASNAQLDALSIDALHMMAMVDTAPEDQLRWGRQALAVMEKSAQPDARQWEASLRNNVGYALQQLGRYDEALAEFKLSLAARERTGNVRGARIAYWMIAKTLRLMGRLDEAVAIQLRLESEWEQAGTPDPYVFEELELLQRALKNEERANHYAARLKAAR